MAGYLRTTAILHRRCDRKRCAPRQRRGLLVHGRARDDKQQGGVDTKSVRRPRRTGWGVRLCLSQGYADDTLALGHALTWYRWRMDLRGHR
jgi:hypothetical protein